MWSIRRPIRLFAAALCLVAVACDVGPMPGSAPGDFRADDDVIPANPNGAYPVILAHGFLSNSENGFAMAIAQALLADGFTVVRTEVPPMDGVATRAQALGRQIDIILGRTGAPKVHIIAHSMGGLDSRYAVSSLGYGDRVASLSTISTPHRGSALADVALGLSSSASGQAEVLLFLSELLGISPTESLGLQAALHDLSEEHAGAFNAQVADVPGIVYQSWAGLSTVGGIPNINAQGACAPSPGAPRAAASGSDTLRPLFTPIAPVVGHGLELRPQDGIVTVESAHWGMFRGCIPADHFDETGTELNPTPNFDAVAFYRTIAGELMTMR